MHRELWCGKQEETDHLRDLCTNRRIILKRIVMKKVAGFSQRDNEVSLLDTELASQEELCSMELCN